MSSLRTTTPFDVGDAAAPEGSSAWCRAVYEKMCRLKHNSEATIADLKYSLISFRQKSYFTHLTDRSGTPFITWEDFVQYTEPYGLGMRADVVDAVITEADDRQPFNKFVAQQLAKPEGVTALAKHGRPKKDEEKDNNVILKRQGNSAAYLVARLKRDHPEIAERLAAGEFPSARAAARAAGIKVDTPSLVLLRRAWKRATPEERATFRAEICG